MKILAKNKYRPYQCRDNGIIRNMTLEEVIEFLVAQAKGSVATSVRSAKVKLKLLPLSN